MVVVVETLKSSVMETAKESEPKKLGLGEVVQFLQQDQWRGSVGGCSGDGEIGPIG